ncbi:unnamed protein product [Pieris macdunnoughi]|uniref:Uncharacterized protein n=1 Tax=Pieris macdunnoughi TaxID=345717 RepID=A0A821XMY5_9NEOP|nr:unnamed protein product [Pieris macdunnoughi]
MNIYNCSVASVFGTLLISASLEGDHDMKISKDVVEDDLHDMLETNNFNITALQTLFKIDKITKVWFLVLDEDVFLKKLNFIKEIRNADNRCRLVVPECVLNRIQKGTTSVNKIHMKRALQAAIFISNVLTENCAIVDKENRHDDHTQNIVACYRKYSQKDYKVVLQEAAFQTTPPPWTMYEACECIKRGFKNDADIVDAANKLGDIIFDNGALRGKINHNINPSTFMKIYSYGVYLVDTLQDVFEDDENLQAAEKLLAKLLLDIETPDFNNSFNEIDAINEHSDEVCFSASPQKTSQNHPTSSRITRSMARNIMTSVQERAHHSKDKLLQFLPGKENFLSNFELKNADKDETNEPENIDKTDCVNTKTDEPPKIIRNFIRISNIEDKLDPNGSVDLDNLDFILDGAEVPEKKTYTHIDFIEQTKAKLRYVFKFCQDTRQRLLNPEKLDKKDVNCQAKKFAELIRFCRLQLAGIYERRKDIYLNVLNFNEAEYNYNKEFVKHCLDECAILNTALSIIITETGSTLQ